MTRTASIWRRPITGGVVGWDIGGVNTKVARVAESAPSPDHRLRPPLGAPTATIRPYEIQRDPAALPALLASLAQAVGHRPGDAHAVTMTAELSQLFRRKRDGVAFVLDAVAAAFPGDDIGIFGTRGAFLSVEAAREDPIAVAAANWAATAALVAQLVGTALLIDIGTTTTDVIPIVDGTVCAAGLTDPDRLRSGELLYLGAVRTPVEAITHAVPIDGGMAGVSAEGFALAGDVHLWRGTLPPSAYAVPTPDGRPATRELAGERLARVVCGDRELLDTAALDAIANAVADAQVARTAAAIARVRARHPRIATAVVTGIGDFIAAAAAARAGLAVRHLADDVGLDASHAAPAAAVAILRAMQSHARVT